MLEMKARDTLADDAGRQAATIRQALGYLHCYAELSPEAISADMADQALDLILSELHSDRLPDVA